ncbi:synaptic vesicle glycoprotein 2B [Anabrus simplex]|uniref:synaptic vesicle glycoprotein 2B n=1 Tax=Anabrus simplex TaxID=316456 RepID=UPI0035A2D3BF
MVIGHNKKYTLDNIYQGHDEPVHFEEALVKAGRGWFHLKLQLVCGICLMSTIVEMLSTGYVLPSAECDLGISTQLKGIVNAIAFLGMLFSSHLWGFLADTKGRRKILILTLVMDGLCTVLSSLSHHVWLLMVFRFFNGFFICGSAAVLFAYLGEFHSEVNRARAIVWLGVFVALGTISLPGLAWLVIPLDLNLWLPWGPYYSWRLFLVLCAVPSLTAALLFATVLPRSPKFLLVSGKHQEAVDVLSNMFAANTGKSADQYPVKAIQMDSQPRRESVLAAPPVANVKSARELFKNMLHQTLPLFRPPYLVNTLLACLLDFAIFSCANGFQLWLPELFNRVSQYTALHPGHDLTMCEMVHALVNHTAQEEEPRCSNDVDSEVFQNTLIIGGATALAYILAGYLVPHLGKRNVLISSMVTSGLGGIVLYFMRSPDSVLALSCIFVGLSTMCVSVVNSIVVDLFPTQLRAMAVCLSLMCGRLGTIVGSLVVGQLLELSCGAVFFVLSGIILGCGFMGFLIPRSSTISLA